MVYVDKQSLEELLAQKSALKRSLGAVKSPAKGQNLQARFHAQVHEKTIQAKATSAKPLSVPLSMGDDESCQAFKKIERLVKVRDRSIKEVEDRLIKDEYSPKAIKEALARTIRCGYLDDARFADTLIRTRLRAGKGLSGIVSELKRHGINPETDVPGFPDEYLSMFPNQRESALALLLKKPPHAKNQLQAAYAKLVRNGYSSSIASEVAREWYRIKE